jgi:hypothetical protein
MHHYKFGQLSSVRQMMHRFGKTWVEQGHSMLNLGVEEA